MIKRGKDRQMALAKVSLRIGSRWLGNKARSAFMTDGEKAHAEKVFWQKNADYLADELSKLKGSAVKIGQMLALYGEPILPSTLIDALHRLDAHNNALPWHSIQPIIMRVLGDKFGEFIIDPNPIGAASLAQVHKATWRNQQVVLKVQYPHIVDAIDNDLAAVAQLFKLSRVLPQTRLLDEWLDEIGALLHQECNYLHEARQASFFAQALANDNRFIVPKVHFAHDNLLCFDYVDGKMVQSASVAALSQATRNQLGQAMLDLLMREIFEFGRMQTDPNFGNYLIQIDGAQARLALLDFGAIKVFDGEILTLAQALLRAGIANDFDKTYALLDNDMPFFNNLPNRARRDIANLCLLACLPLRTVHTWDKSDIYPRLVAGAKNAMTSLQVSTPPKETLFIARKFIGVYAFLQTLGATTQPVYGAVDV